MHKEAFKLYGFIRDILLYVAISGSVILFFNNNRLNIFDIFDILMCA